MWFNSLLWRQVTDLLIVNKTFGFLFCLTSVQVSEADKINNKIKTENFNKRQLQKIVGLNVCGKKIPNRSCF